MIYFTFIEKADNLKGSKKKPSLIQKIRGKMIKYENINKQKNPGWFNSYQHCKTLNILIKIIKNVI